LDNFFKKILDVEKMKKKNFFNFLSGKVLRRLPLKKFIAEKAEKTGSIFDTGDKVRSL
jgi:hypothetical protein